MSRLVLTFVLATGLAGFGISASAQEKPATPEESSRADAILDGCKKATEQMMQAIHRAQTRGGSPSYTFHGPDGKSVSLTEDQFIEFKNMECFVNTGLQDPVVGPRIRLHLERAQHAPPNV